MKADILVETPPVAELDTFTDYETERGKPTPTFIHGTIQSKLSRILGNSYDQRFMLPNELSLATEPGSTPDICIYPKRELDVRDEEARRPKCR